MGGEATRTLPEIQTEELRRKIEGGEQFALVDALSALSFVQSRPPGAVNIPPERVDELAPRLIPDRAAEIVVYCMSLDCDSSIEVGRRLVELGYANVRHYAEGKRGWAKAGLQFERGAKPPRVRRRERSQR